MNFDKTANFQRNSYSGVWRGQFNEIFVAEIDEERFYTCLRDCLTNEIDTFHESVDRLKLAQNGFHYPYFFRDKSIGRLKSENGVWRTHFQYGKRECLFLYLHYHREHMREEYYVCSRLTSFP